MSAGSLVERELELSALAGAVDAARAGDGRVVVLHGPAGVGKTALLSALRGSARERGFTVLSARGSELERSYPHGVARQLVDRIVAERPPNGPARHAIEALGLAGGSGPAGGSAFAIHHGLYWLIADAAAAAPLVIAVDDVQWSDAPSLAFLAHLAGRLDGLPVLVALTVRSGDEPEGGGGLTSLLADPTAEWLRPRPLSATGSRSLLASRLAVEPDPAFADAAHAATLGNPFLLRALCDAVRAERVAPDADGAQAVATLAPAAVTQAVLRRVARLPEPVLELARAVAVLGDRATAAGAAALAGIEPAEAAAAADELRRLGILEDEAEPRLVHPLVRTSLYQDIPPGRRAEAHRRAVAILRDSGHDVHVLASHVLAGAPAGDEAAVAVLRDAARRALAGGAPAQAVELLRRALAEPPGDDGRGALLADLGEAELVAGDAEAATRHLSEALAAAPAGAERARGATLLSRARAAITGPGAAVEVLEAALAEIAAGEPAADEAAAAREVALRLEAELAAVAILHEPSPDIGRRLDAHSDLPGETAGERLLLANLARQTYLSGRPAERAAQLARRALGDGALLSDDDPEGIPFFHAVWVLALADEIAEADRALEQAEAAARRSGGVYAQALSALGRTIPAWRRGDLPAVEADARRALAALDDHRAYMPIAVAMLVDALTGQGALDDAAQVLDDHRDLAADDSLLPVSRLLHARATLDLARDRAGGALADVEVLRQREQRWSVSDVHVSWRPLAALAHRRQGDDELARRWALEHVERARASGPPSALGDALRVHALCGPPDEAPATLAEAVALLEPSPARLAHARALVDLGAALRRAGRRREAREPLQRAVDLARACGATPLATRAHEELAAAGARPRRLMFSGADSLTASERRIARLAATGLTNREIAQELFVTAKTVDNHLTRTYSKLGIRSRKALADALGGSHAR
jgi:DNA-binding CsgD family transcriptional regulator